VILDGHAFGDGVAILFRCPYDQEVDEEADREVQYLPLFYTQSTNVPDEFFKDIAGIHIPVKLADAVRFVDNFRFAIVNPVTTVLIDVDDRAICHFDLGGSTLLNTDEVNVSRDVCAVFVTVAVPDPVAAVFLDKD
jgi:hypothetical protein